VGPELSKKEMVGQITQIVVRTETPETAPAEAEPTTAPAAGAQPAGTPVEIAEMPGVTLTISGAVGQETTFAAPNLQALGAEEITAEHPKQGPLTYQGWPLGKLLMVAAPNAEATTLTLVASDGYTSQVPLADAMNCAPCMAAVDDEFGLNMVMPGFESMAWVKGVVELVVE
jgi:hypothetical protein